MDNASGAEQSSEKNTTAKCTAVKNANKKQEENKSTTPGDDGSTKTKAHYTKNN